MTAPGDLVVEAATPAPPRRRRGTVIGAAMVVVLALVLTAVVSFRWGSAGSPAALPSVSPDPSAAEQLSTAQIYAALAPSVVTIQTMSPGTDRVNSTGTGVVANADGVILTALHVVKGADSIAVTFADGTTSAATVTSADPAMDIAALAPATIPCYI